MSGQRGICPISSKGRVLCGFPRSFFVWGGSSFRQARTSRGVFVVPPRTRVSSVLIEGVLPYPENCVGMRVPSAKWIIASGLQFGEGFVFCRSVLSGRSGWSAR